MSVTTGVENLRRVVERFAQEGSTAGTELVAEVRGLALEAQAGSLDELARICGIAAERIEQGLAPNGGCSDLDLDQLGELVDYAASWADAMATGEDCPTPEPTPALARLDGEDQRHFRETLDMFVSDAIGSVTALEADIRAIGALDQAQHGEVIGGIRRLIHTLKAEFGVLDLQAAHQLCQEAETAIAAVVECRAEFPVDLVLECADVLKNYLEQVPAAGTRPFPAVTELLRRLRQAAESAGAGRGRPEADDKPVELIVEGEFADCLGQSVNEARSHLGDAEAAMLAFAAERDPEQLEVASRALHAVKGVAGFLNLTPLAALTHAAEALLEEARGQGTEPGREEALLVLAAVDLSQRMVDGLDGRPMPSQRLLTELRAKLDAAVSRPTDGPAAGHDAGACDTGDDHSDLSEAVVARSPEIVVAESSAVLPLPVVSPVPEGVPGEQLLDTLVDLVGELVTAHSTVLRDPAVSRLESPALVRNLGQVGKITRDLHDAARSLRRVPVAATFAKMAQVVCDVAQQSGKRVALTVQGADTEIDRTLLDRLSGPLEQLIRFGIECGLESPEERRAAGKDPEGKLLLRACQQAGSIVIELTDDGRGLDRERLVRRAVEHLVLPPGADVAGMADAAALELVFAPGLMNAGAATDRSGRGVGLDVVRRAVEALRGKLELAGELGKGTAFRLCLPPTPTVIDGLVVRVGGQRFVVPTAGVVQSLRPAAADLRSLTDGAEGVRVGGTALPIRRLKRMFGQQSGCDELTAGVLVVVEAGGGRGCLFVDEVVDRQQVMIRGLGIQDERVSGIAGGAILSDGRIALVLDLASLLGRAMAG